VDDGNAEPRAEPACRHVLGVTGAERPSWAGFRRLLGPGVGARPSGP
jgi:hypothetical protein